MVWPPDFLALHGLFFSICSLSLPSSPASYLMVKVGKKLVFGAFVSNNLIFDDFERLCTGTGFYSYI